MGEQFWIVEQATGLHEVGIRQLPISSSCSIMANAALIPQPNVFTPPNQHPDILQRFLLLYSSAFVVPTWVSIFGMILTIKSSFWPTVGDIKGFSVLTHRSFFAVSRSRPNQIAGPVPKSGPARKSESRGPENGVSRWRRPNSDIYSQNHHFGLVYDMIYQFLGMEAKNYKFGIFCQNAIRPWPQVMPIFDREMPPGFTPAICLRRNFVYISNLENRGDKSLVQNF